MPNFRLFTNQFPDFRGSLSHRIQGITFRPDEEASLISDLGGQATPDFPDALFGKRTSTNTSNDRHANQEVAYLLQRIEDFPGTVILATNLKSNIDEAFSRRFQSIIYFPMPSEELRAELWHSMLPKEWLGDDAEDLIATASQSELSGGSIANVVRKCAVQLVNKIRSKVDKNIILTALNIEKNN